MTTYEIDIPAARESSPTRWGWRLAAVAAPVLRPVVTTVVNVFRGPLVDFDDDIDPQYLRSYVSIGYCVNCERTRILDTSGACETCGSLSIPPNRYERRTHGKEQTEGSPDAHEGREEGVQIE